MQPGGLSQPDGVGTPSGSGVGLAEICRLVCLRERLRKGKEFVEADQVRQQLSEYGVSLEDKARLWTCAIDGSTGRIPSFNDLESGQDDISIAGTAFDDVPMLNPTLDDPMRQLVSEDDDDTTMHIKSLVSARERARATKQFEEADRLREELKQLGVELMDKEKIWTQASSSRRGVILGYQQDGPTTLEVQALVYRREKARQEGDFELGDLIRRELQVHKVMIFDKDKMWKGPNGQSGVVPTWSEVAGGAVAPPAAAAKTAASTGIIVGGRTINVSPNDPRVSAVLAIMPELAPILQGGAVPARAVPVLPAQRTAPVPTSTRTTVPGQNTEAQKALQFIKTKGQGYLNDTDIQWLVSMRERARAQKDFAGADHIREAMRSIGMDVNDKDKTWTANDGRMGPIPAWSAIEGAVA